MNTARPGDTVIEVTFAILVFSAVAVSAIALMNNSTNTAQASLEITMARTEINSQAEALRFIHNAFTMERGLPLHQQQYVALWRSIDEISRDNQAEVTARISAYPISTCDAAYNLANPTSVRFPDEHNIFQDSAFIINTRNLQVNLGEDTDINTVIIFSRTRGKPFDAANVDARRFRPATLFPRIIYTNPHPQAIDPDQDDYSTAYISDQIGYTNIEQAEGIWIIPVASQTTSSAGMPEFYDFHIRTCWYAPGKLAPSTISTTIRLYNPEYTERSS